MIEIEAPQRTPSQILDFNTLDKVFETELGVSKETIALKFDPIRVEEITYDPKPKSCFNCGRKCRKFKLRINGGGFCSKCMEEMKHD